MGHSGNIVDPKKVFDVQNWPRPESLTDLRGVLGLVKLFKNYTNISRPLTELTKKDKGIKA